MSSGVDFGAGLPTISTEDMRDLLKSVKDVYPFAGVIETLQAYQSHPGVELLVQNRMEQGGGTAAYFSVQNIGTGRVQVTTPYEAESVAEYDSLIRGRVEWGEYKSHYAISHEELSENTAAGNQIVDLLDRKRTDTMMQFADFIEADFWGTPSTGRPVRLFGANYWFQPITTGQTAGFNGTYATGFSDCGNISPSTYPRWKGYNDRWNTAANFAGVITDTDVDKFTTMFRKLHFRVPTFVPGVENTTENMMRCFTGNEVMLGLDQRARKNNDNLGNDVTRYAGEVLINKLPVEWVPLLDYANASTYPFYAINFRYMKFIIQRGWYFRETGPLISQANHNVVVTWSDLLGQTAVTNRQRAGGRIDAVVV